MDTLQSNHINGNYNKKRRTLVPIIPLVLPEKHVLIKGEYIFIKFCSIPFNNNSLTFNLPLLYFKTGTAEEYLRWIINLEKACIDQGCTSGPSKYAMARRFF